MPLVLQVSGDLPCRIIALLSGICWAETFQTSLEVYWWYLPNMAHCPFDRLFRLESLPSWVVIKHGYLENPIKIKSHEEFVEKGYPLVCKSDSYFWKEDSSRWVAHFRRLRPSSFLQSKINLIPCSNGIGIYDHANVDCPMAQILSTIWTQYRDPKQYLIFTDSQDTTTVCKIMFKENAFFLDGQAASHTEQYLFNQLIALYTFSQCHVILDSSRSLLMKLASQLGDIPLINLKPSCIGSKC